MRRSAPRRILVGLAVAVTLIGALPIAAVYALSEWRLRREHDAPFLALAARRPVDLAEGERMAKIVGCWAGCHGPRGEGGHMGLEGVVRNTAPTLSAVLPLYSEEELVRLVRFGVKRDGRSALGMISYTFWSLSDEDLADIFAHLRLQPPAPAIPRELELTLRGRIALATGRWKVSAEQVDRLRPRWGELPRTTPFERGRYLASVTCSECHGVEFRGDALEGAPSLALIAAYSPEAFRHFLRTGEALGGRELETMSDVAREAFSLFTDQEIADIYAFLRTHHGEGGAVSGAVAVGQEAGVAGAAGR